MTPLILVVVNKTARVKERIYPLQGNLHLQFALLTVRVRRVAAGAVALSGATR